jgi:hypothetical protein
MRSPSPRRALDLIRGRSALGRRRLALVVALGIAAAVLRGSAGVLLAVAAVVLIADALFPPPGGHWSEADFRFNRLVFKRRRVGRLRRLRGLAPELLDVLDDGGGWVATASRRALGVKSIPIDSITGTVEDAKARVFDRRFRPDHSARARWNGLWLAQAHGAALPPISVYRVESSYFVRDGHHRVSVARDYGWSTIEADVVELRHSHPPVTSRGEASSA